MVSSQAVPIGVRQFPFASLGRRIGAYLIDGLILGAVFLALAFTLKWLRILGFWTPPEVVVETAPEVQFMSLGIPLQISVILGYFVLLGLFYWAFLEASPWQATVGKRLLDMHVTDATGKRLSLGRSFSRSFAKCFFTGFYVGAISIFTIALDAQKQALHDKVAKTRVVRGRPSVSGPIEMWWAALAVLGFTYLWLVVTFTAVFRKLR